MLRDATLFRRRARAMRAASARSSTTLRRCLPVDAALRRRLPPMRVAVIEQARWLMAAIRECAQECLAEYGAARDAAARADEARRRAFADATMSATRGASVVWLRCEYAMRYR